MIDIRYIFISYALLIIISLRLMPIFYPILSTITMRRDAAGFQRDHLNLILVENNKAFLHNR